MQGWQKTVDSLNEAELFKDILINKDRDKLVEAASIIAKQPELPEDPIRELINDNDAKKQANGDNDQHITPSPMPNPTSTRRPTPDPTPTPTARLI